MCGVKAWKNKINITVILFLQTYSKHIVFSKNTPRKHYVLVRFHLFTFIAICSYMQMTNQKCYLILLKTVTISVHVRDNTLIK